MRRRATGSCAILGRSVLWVRVSHTIDHKQILPAKMTTRRRRSAGRTRTVATDAPPQCVQTSERYWWMPFGSEGMAVEKVDAGIFCAVFDHEFLHNSHGFRWRTAVSHGTHADSRFGVAKRSVAVSRGDDRADQWCQLSCVTTCDDN